MTAVEAKRIVERAMDDAHKFDTAQAPLYLLAAADALGYRDPLLAVKQACIALYGEVRVAESKLAALATGTLTATTPA